MRLIVWIGIMAAFVLSSCSDSDSHSGSNDPLGAAPATDTTLSISGVVQKGPFAVGTPLFLYELDNNLNQTGKSFYTVTSGNDGRFSFDRFGTKPGFAKLIADGYYFNEVTGSLSPSTLALHAISDLTGKSTVNVNLLTTLEKDRVEYLILSGKTLKEAKTQAQKEILAMFQIPDPGITEAESLDFTQAGEGNAILMAISAIIQGYRSEAEITELLSKIGSDLRTDGTLDDSMLGSQLLNDARLLNLSAVRSNIESRYASLGIQTAIPSFESHVGNFTQNVAYPITKFIQYPASGSYGKNILNDNFTGTDLGPYGSAGMTAVLPKGTSLKIVMKNGVWGYSSGAQDFQISAPSLAGDSRLINEQTFTVTASTLTDNATVDLYMFVNSEGPDGILVEFYENGATTPTKTRRIRLTGVGSGVTSSASTISGIVQKGPYSVGTPIYIYELGKTLNQTGKAFFTETTGNDGRFSFSSFEIKPGYVKIIANGYYFNETIGELSPSTQALYALIDLTSKSTANVNVLTTLEQKRVEYLILAGKSLQEAKSQAQNEILAIFQIANAGVTEAESLDFTQAGEGNAILMAISAIIQGYRSEAEITELLSKIGADLRTDGTLDDIALGSALINDARFLNLSSVRSNIESRYASMGIQTTIPPFETYVTNFVQKTTFPVTKVIQYPTDGLSGKNMLNDGFTVAPYKTYCSMRADLPRGTSLKVVLKNGTWLKDGTWGGFFLGDNEGILASNPVMSSNGIIIVEQTFTFTHSTLKNPVSVDLRMYLMNAGTGGITVEYYENGATTPTKTKIITLN